MKVIIYLLISISLLATTLFSTNGNNSFFYNDTKNIIENLDINFSKNGIDIDKINFGFFVDGKQYEIGEENYNFSYIDGTNILTISSEFEKIRYKIYMYSSQTDKNSIIVRTEIEKKSDYKDLSVYYYVKPKNMGLMDNTYPYVFDSIYFRSSTEGLKIYSTIDSDFKEKALKPLIKDSFVNLNNGLFFVSELNNNERSENYFCISKSKDSSSFNFFEKEVEFWNKQLENEKEKVLYANLKMHADSKGFLVKNPNGDAIISVEDLLLYGNLLLIKKDYKELKKIMEYLIFDTDKNIMGILASDAYDVTWKEKIKKDNFGEYFSYYRKCQFLRLYLKYLIESKDEELYKSSFEIVKTKLIDLILSKNDKNGVEPDSGNSRIGHDGFERFVETQFEVYKTFKLLITFSKSKNIKTEEYQKLVDKEKEVLIIYYIDKLNIVDYPFSKKRNLKNIYYVDESLFLSENDYFLTLQKNVELLKNEKKSLKDKIIFINFLYDKKFYLMANELRNEIENELSGVKGLELLQKDLGLLINYLLMKEKGEVYGVNK